MQNNPHCMWHERMYAHSLARTHALRLHCMHVDKGTGLSACAFEPKTQTQQKLGQFNSKSQNALYFYAFLLIFILLTVHSKSIETPLIWICLGCVLCVFCSSLSHATYKWHLFHLEPNALGIVGDTKQHDVHFNLNIVHSCVDFISFLMFDRTGNKTRKNNAHTDIFCRKLKPYRGKFIIFITVSLMMNGKKSNHKGDVPSMCKNDAVDEQKIRTEKQTHRL